jgi:geranylgeranyl pyrophosphate synthase
MQYIDQNIFDLCSFSFHKANKPDLFKTSVDDFINNEILGTCSLYKCSMELAGLLLPCNQLIRKQLEKSGKNLGIAISINKHISELSQTEENANQNNSDILNKKKNLPILFAIQMANKSDLDLIKKIYQKRMLDFSDLKTLNSIVENLNIYKQCYGLLDQYHIKAKDISFVNSSGSVLFNLVDALMKSN